MKRFTIGEDRTGESLTIETDDIKLVEAVSRILSGGTAITTAEELDEWSDEIQEAYEELTGMYEGKGEMTMPKFIQYDEPEKHCTSFTIRAEDWTHTLGLTEYEKNILWRALHDYQQEKLMPEASRYKELEAIKARLQSK